MNEQGMRFVFLLCILALAFLVYQLTRRRDSRDRLASDMAMNISKISPFLSSVLAAVCYFMGLFLLILLAVIIRSGDMGDETGPVIALIGMSIAMFFFGWLSRRAMNRNFILYDEKKIIFYRALRKPCTADWDQITVKRPKLSRGVIIYFSSGGKIQIDPAWTDYEAFEQVLLKKTAALNQQ